MKQFKIILVALIGGSAIQSDRLSPVATALKLGDDFFELSSRGTIQCVALFSGR